MTGRAAWLKLSTILVSLPFVGLGILIGIPINAFLIGFKSAEVYLLERVTP